MRRYISVVLIAIVAISILWSRGVVPFSGDFQRAWFEPWKTDTAVNGVPAIPHKAIGDDVFRQIFPFKVLSANLMRQGRLPLWNPYNGAGQPLFAIQHFGLVNPLSLAFFVASPAHAWTTLYVGQFLAIAVFSFLYTASLGMTPVGMVFAAVVWLVSGYVITNSIFGTYLYAYAGLPFLLWSIDRLVLRRRGGVGWLPVAISWVILTGFPQLSLYMLFVAVAYAVFRVRESGRVKDTALWMTLVIAGILGLGLVAFQLIPTAELSTRAAISTQTSAFIFLKFLVPIGHFITVLVPNFFGNPAIYNYWGRVEYIESVSSVGSGAFLFAVFAMVFRKGKHPLLPIFFAGVAIGSVLLSLRWWGTEFLYRLPIPILTTGAPSRIMSMATFAIAMLAGLGMDAFLRVKKTRTMLWLIIGVGAMLGIILFVTITLVRLHVPCNNPIITACFSIALRNTMLESAAYGIIMLTLFISLYTNVSRRVVGWIVIMTVLVFGAYDAYKFIPFTNTQNVMPQHRLLTALRSFAPNRVAYTGTASIATDFATYYRFYDDNYYDPLYVRRYGELVSYVNTGDRSNGILRSDVTVVPDASVSAALSKRRERFWDMTGTEGLLVRKSEMNSCRPKDPLDSRNCDRLWEDANWVVYQRQSAYPRAYLTNRVISIADPDKELMSMFAEGTNLATTSFVETPVSGWIHTDGVVGSATISSYETDRVSIHTQTQTMAFLVLSDNDYPGWKATVDENEVTVYRTNYAFRGVVVPKGKHTVMFRYEPASLNWGIALSIISFVFWLGFAWTGRRKS